MMWIIWIVALVVVLVPWSKIFSRKPSESSSGSDLPEQQQDK